VASERRSAITAAAGRARFICAPFLDAELGRTEFDRIVAARVADMARRPHLARAASILAPGGRLVLAFDSPDDRRTSRLVDEAMRNAAGVGLRCRHVRSGPIDGTSASCVIAVRPPG
jgi:hypothetical protein